MSIYLNHSNQKLVTYYLCRKKLGQCLTHDVFHPKYPLDFQFCLAMDCQDNNTDIQALSVNFDPLYLKIQSVVLLWSSKVQEKLNSFISSFVLGIRKVFTKMKRKYFYEVLKPISNDSF